MQHQQQQHHRLLRCVHPLLRSIPFEELSCDSSSKTMRFQDLACNPSISVTTLLNIIHNIIHFYLNNDGDCCVVIAPWLKHRTHNNNGHGRCLVLPPLLAEERNQQPKKQSKR